MDSKTKLIFTLSFSWMIIAAGLFLAVLLKWLDRETFKLAFVIGFVLFSIVVSTLTLAGKNRKE